MGSIELWQNRPICWVGLCLHTTQEQVVSSYSNVHCLQGISQATYTEVEAAQRSDGAVSTGPSSEIEEVLLLERLIWQTLDSIVLLASKAKRVVREVLLPPAVLWMRPKSLGQELFLGESQRAASNAAEASTTEEADSLSGTGTMPDRGAQAAQSSCTEAAEAGAGTAGQQLHADDLYPPLRQAQRLAYSLATVLHESFDYAEGRQVCLSSVHSIGVSADSISNCSCGVCLGMPDIFCFTRIEPHGHKVRSHCGGG